MQIQPASLPTLYRISADFVMVTADGALHALKVSTNKRMTRDGFIQFCSKHYGDVFIIDAQNNPVRKDSGTIWWQWDDVSRRVVSTVVMEPTKEPEDPYGETFNRWYVLKHEMAVPDMTCDMSAVKKLYDHLMFISDNDHEGSVYFLHWMAWLWQNPDAKIPVAIMLYSKFGGVGKTILSRLLSHIFGAPLVCSVRGSVINSRFMDAVEHKRIAVLNELARADRQDVYEDLKSLISDPETTFEGKGRAVQLIANYLHLIITTNNADCLPLMAGDRRVLVLRCESKPKEQEYYDELNDWIDGDAPEQLAGCFARWTFPPEFNPNGHAPQTKATRVTQKESRNGFAILIEELLVSKKPPFDKDMGRITGMIEQLNTLYPGNLKAHKVNNKTLPTALSQLGAKHEHVNITAKDGARMRVPVWIWRNYAQWMEGPEADISDYLSEG